MIAVQFARAPFSGHVSRIFQLALLAPDNIEAVLAGKADPGLVLERLELPLPASWEEQRARIT